MGLDEVTSKHQELKDPLSSQVSHPSLTREARYCIITAMKTFPFLALFLLGFASTATAEWWELGNIEIFRTYVSDGMCRTCLGEDKANQFCEGWMRWACPPAPPLNQANWMLNNLAEGKMSCDMIYNFRQLIEHELCVARKGGIFEGESEWADPNWKSFERLFDDTMLEGAKQRGKKSINQCIRGAESVFLNKNIKAIMAAFEWGARGCNIDPEFRGEDQPIKELLRRVANFNCMKRTFVSECWGAIEKKRGKEKDE